MNRALMDDVAALHTIHEAVEQATVGQVFGAPISHDGVTVVPVAKIGGAGGAGDDETSGAGPSSRRPEPSDPAGAPVPCAPLMVQ